MHERELSFRRKPLRWAHSRGRQRPGGRPAEYPSRGPPRAAGGVPAGHQSHMRHGPGRRRHPLITGDDERPCTIVAINLPRRRCLTVFSARPLEFAVSIVALSHSSAQRCSTVCAVPALSVSSKDWTAPVLYVAAGLNSGALRAGGHPAWVVVLIPVLERWPCVILNHVPAPSCVARQLLP